MPDPIIGCSTVDKNLVLLASLLIILKAGRLFC
jgi:hypothetical protein